MLIGYISRHGQNTAFPLVLLLLRVLLAGSAAAAVTAEGAGGAGVSISRQIKMLLLHLPVFINMFWRLLSMIGQKPRHGQNTACSLVLVHDTVRILLFHWSCCCCGSC